MIKYLTRGGQINLHNIRMTAQVLKVWIKWGMVFACLLFVVVAFWKMSGSELEFYKNMKLARARYVFDQTAQQSFTLNGVNHQYSITQILNHPYFLRAEAQIESKLLSVFFQSGLIILGLGSLVCGFWIVKGKKQIGKNFQRGTQIVPMKTLRQIIKKNRAQSKYHIDGLPLLKQYETRGMLITGTTGSGKTNCLNGLIKQIISDQKPAVIIDLTGGFTQKFYHPKTDILLNPFDRRGTHWAIWEDLKDEAMIEEFAKSLIPDAKAHADPFWSNAARSVLVDAILKFRAEGQSNLKLLYKILAEMGLKKFEAYLKDTQAGNLIDPSADRMAISIRATLITHIKLFKHLHGMGEGLSIREWIKTLEQNPNQRIFITCSQKYREILKPLISAWFSLFINATMALEPNDQRRIWLIMDELAALQKLNHLPTALAEIRKYGGCIVGCLQNRSQLEELYGHHALKSMLDNFNTKLFFRSTGREISHWISETLGKSETLEKIENLSYGSHAMRDGVSISNQTKTAPILLPEEIQQFEDLEVVVKFPGNYPITRFKTKYHAIKNTQEAFIDNGKIQQFEIKEATHPDTEKNLLDELNRLETEQLKKDYEQNFEQGLV